MVDSSEITKGDFLNAETCKDGAIVEVIGKAEFSKIPNRQKPGQKKRVLDIPVRCENKEMKYTPGFKSLKKLQNIFGTTESDDWLHKKFIAKHKEIEVAGNDMIVIRPKALEEKPTTDISRD